MSEIVEKNNAPAEEGDDILLHQQHFLNSSENVLVSSWTSLLSTLLNKDQAPAVMGVMKWNIING